jgi:hypothetical protein
MIVAISICAAIGIAVLIVIALPSLKQSSTRSLALQLGRDLGRRRQQETSVALALALVDDAAAAGLAQQCARSRCTTRDKTPPCRPADTDSLSLAKRDVDGLLRELGGIRCAAEALWPIVGAEPKVTESLLEIAGVPAELAPGALAGDGYLRRATPGLPPAAAPFAQAMLDRGGLPSPGSGARPRCTGVLGDLSALPSETGAPEVLRAAGALASVSHLPDRHSRDRADLDGRLTDLGLLVDETILEAQIIYRGNTRKYEDELARRAAELCTTVRHAVTSAWDVAGAVICAPPDLNAGDVDVAAALAEERAATAKYLREIQGVVAAAAVDEHTVEEYAALQKRLTDVEADLAHWPRDGTLPELVARNARGYLPIATAWTPSRAYVQACARTVNATAAMVLKRRIAYRAWLDDATAAIRAVFGDVAGSIDAGLSRYDEQLENAWRNLQSAAVRLIGDAAEALEKCPPTSDAGLATRAAAALALLDERGAMQLHGAAGELIPDSFHPDGAVDSQEMARRLEAAAARLDHNVVAWAGASALLTQALNQSAGRAGSWSQIMTALSGGSEHLVRAASDLSAWTSGGFPVDVHAAAQEFVRNALLHVAPGGAAPVHDGVLDGLFHAVTSFTGSLEGHILLGPDDIGLAVASYLSHQAAHAVVDTTPAVHEALLQLSQAGHLAAVALHGLAGHMPLLTIVVSSRREFNAVRDEGIAIAEAVQNVLIDVGLVGGGITAAALAGGALGLHGLALIPVTVPLGMAGGILAQKRRLRPKLKRVQLAIDQCNQSYEQYKATVDDLFGTFAGSVDTVFVAERRAFRRDLNEPQLLEDTAHDRLEALTEAIYQTEVQYIARARALLIAAGARLDKGPSDDDSAATLALRQAENMLARATAEKAGGDAMKALLTLTEIQLPTPAAWAPAHDYTTACSAFALELRDATRQQRQLTAAWMESTTARFQRSKLTINQLTETSLATYK